MASVLHGVNPPKWKIKHALKNLHCRPFIERLNKIHERINSGEFPNYRTLAEELEVSAKTIQRDFEFMGDRLRLPIEYDVNERGYFYTEPVTHLPAFEVKHEESNPSEEEEFVLELAERSLDGFEGEQNEFLRTGIERLKTRLYGFAR